MSVCFKSDTDHCCTPYIEAISNATESIDVHAMYVFDRVVIAALVEKLREGNLTIRIVTENFFDMTIFGSIDYAWRLERAGIVGLKKECISRHYVNKFTLIDGKTVVLEHVDTYIDGSNKNLGNATIFIRDYENVSQLYGEYFEYMWNNSVSLGSVCR